MGKIINKDGDDEAKFTIRFKGIERYYQYDNIRDFIAEWRDYDEFMEEVNNIDNKSAARRRIDIFLKNIKHIPTDPIRYQRWKDSLDEKEDMV